MSMYATPDSNQWLMVDDVRILNKATVAKNPQEAKELLQQKSWAHLVLDYDLFSKENGLDILVWAITEKLVPQHVLLTTLSRRAKLAMGNLLMGEGYSSSDGSSWYLEEMSAA